MARGDISWEEAIRKVLQDADGTLQVTEIAERIASGGLRKSIGATPAATIAAMLSQSLKDPASPFVRVSRGVYTLKDSGGISVAREIEAEQNPAETGALRAFGMFWQRENVVWAGRPRLLGRQGLGASDVNFAEQIGVYLLHDRDRVIYVGRATDTLFTRLRSHTTDRLGGRWDRFSWFGLRSVAADGTLGDDIAPWTQSVVVETMEALLIESLEPPLNRKRGDNFSAAEYLQSSDPEIEAAKNKVLFEKMMRAANLV